MVHMWVSRRFFSAPVVLCGALVVLGGCSEVRGRRKIQEANSLYKENDYKGAVAAFEEAEKLVPDLPVLWLNKGFTCRQLIVPGTKTPESVSASKCALTAFARYKELKPEDSRGDMLYVQTLFDSDEFDELAKMYEDRYRKNQKDGEAVQGLMQVYTKQGKLDEALQWYRVSADLRPEDPEAQYGVGVFLYQQLFTKGGSPDKNAFDPRPDPNKPKEVKVPPPFGYGDITAQQRIDYADEGIKYLEHAIALRPTYTDAMAYVNLLFRQKSFALWETPDEWQKAIDKAEEWKNRTIALLNTGKLAGPAGDGGAPSSSAPDGGAAVAKAAPAGDQPSVEALPAAAPAAAAPAPKKPAAHKSKRGGK